MGLKSFFVNMFKKSPKNTFSGDKSQYFPEKLYTGKVIKIEKSFSMLIRGSSVKIPDTLIVSDIDSVNIGGDIFEEIDFDKNNKLLYDTINDTFYFMQLQHNEHDVSYITGDSIILDGNNFTAITGVLETNINKLYRIYSRIISGDVDEYLLVTVDKNMVESYWIGVIIQVGMII